MLDFNFVNKYTSRQGSGIQQGCQVCQSLSDLQILISFEKLRSFYTQLILMIFFYSGSKGSRNSPKVLHYPKEKWVLQVYFYFPIRCMHLTLNRNIPIMPISLFWDNAKMCKTLDQFRDPLNMVQEIFHSESSQLFKTVRDLKIGQSLAKRLIKMGHLVFILRKS